MLGGVDVKDARLASASVRLLRLRNLNVRWPHRIRKRAGFRNLPLIFAPYGDALLRSQLENPKLGINLKSGFNKWLIKTKMLKVMANTEYMKYVHCSLLTLDTNDMRINIVIK